MFVLVIVFARTTTRTMHTHICVYLHIIIFIRTNIYFSLLPCSPAQSSIVFHLTAVVAEMLRKIDLSAYIEGKKLSMINYTFIIFSLKFILSAYKFLYAIFYIADETSLVFMFGSLDFIKRAEFHSQFVVLKMLGRGFESDENRMIIFCIIKNFIYWCLYLNHYPALNVDKLRWTIKQ